MPPRADTGARGPSRVAHRAGTLESDLIVRSGIAQEPIPDMTFPLSRPARRTPDGVGTRRRRRARWRSAVAVAMALVVAAPVAGAAVAATEAPAESGRLTVAVSPSGNGVIGASVFSVTFSVTNTGDAPAAGGTVSVALTRSPLTTAAEVTAWLDSDARADTEVATAAVTAVAARGTATSTTAIDLAATGGDLAPGVYPVSAAFPAAQGDLVAHTAIVVPDDASSGGGVAVVVPLTAPPTTTGLLTSDDLATLTAADGGLRIQLDAVTGTTAILAVDPAIVAAIRVLGTAAPASAQQWLSDLLALPNSRFALQFGDADLATQFAAGQGEPLSVSSLDPYMSARNFATTGTPLPASSESPSASSTPSPAAGRTLPSLSELLDIGATRTGVFWPATGSATAGLVSALATGTSTGTSSGTDESETPLTLVSSNTLTGAVGARADAEGAAILSYDADVSAALRTASLASDGVHQAAGLAAASAYASLAVQGASASAPLLVVIDRASGRSSTGLRAAITAATSLAGRTAIDLSAVAAAPATAVTVTGGTAPDSARVDALHGLLDDETALSAFATVLSDPALLTAPERAKILQLLANVWLAVPDQFATAVSDHRDATAKTMGAVAIVPPSDITLLASSAPLTFSVRNDLPWPVTLTLSVNPNDPRLIVQKTAEVSAGSAQSTRVQVPVQARVGSGESTLDLQLRSTAGVPIGSEVRVAVTVRAEWESVGIVLMVVLIGAMLVLGLIRTVRKLRRRGTASPAEDEHGEAPQKEAPQKEDVDG